MKRIIIIVIAWLAVLPVMAQQTVINDPNAVLRDVKGFHGVSVSNAIDVYLSAGNQETVAVSATDVKWRDRIRTEVKDGILHIWLEHENWFNWGERNRKMRVYVSFTTLDKITGSGATNIYVDGVIESSSLDIFLTGASDFKGAIRVGTLQLNLSGASDARIVGTVNGVTTVRSAGASDLKGYDLVTDTCNAHASGASDIRITVNKELNAHASGASGIYYKGAAVIRELHSSGASSVSKKS
ncbi:MAG: hypothetical protein BGO55_29235 [Sphingobacteriales bacterium 50-39]|nr:DUF2807 domain-containing protein [Sphingobacteriales bacterium]OJW60629.1 MAG: hypothetical protein BGO55_29235 [Sphingobacteriales bacterium 50-39]